MDKKKSIKKKNNNKINSLYKKFSKLDLCRELNDSINLLRYFNNSIYIKKKYRYISYSDFYEGIHNLKVLNGIKQIKENHLFNIISDMPKGVIHHAHLFALTDIRTNINFILLNKKIIVEKIFICIDPISKHFLQIFFNMPEKNKWIEDDYSLVKNCILTKNYLSASTPMIDKINKYINLSNSDKELYIKENFIEYETFINEIENYKTKINLKYNEFLENKNKITLIPNMLNKDNIINLFEFSGLSFKIFNNLYISLNLDILTKWDFLEKFTISIGHIIKNKNIFPFFFSNLLYDSYNRNISILELRTSLNSIYEWKEKDGKYKMTDFIINIENEKLEKEYIKQNEKIKQIISMYLIMKNILYDVNDYIDHNGRNILEKKKFTNEFFLKYIQIKDIYQNHRFENNNLHIDFTIICATAKGSKFEKINCGKVFNSFENNYNASKIITNIFGYSKIVGYDLYGEEDIHYNLEKFKNYINNFKEKSIKENIVWNYYFHAGENHNIYTKNVNLEVAVDNAKRIGHGLQLINDSNVLQLIKKWK